jgi:hypothetical protein
VLYFVSPGETVFMTSNSQTTGTVGAGTALLQSGTPFAANPLSGSYVGYDSGTGATGVGRTDLYLWGPFTSGNNAFTGVGYRNTGGSFNSIDYSGGTYSVSADGRSILSAPGHTPLLYLVNASQAFLMLNNASVDSGFVELQSGGPFSTSSATGTYAIGYIDPELAGVGATSGVATLTPDSNSISISLDGNASGTLVIDQMQNQTYSIDDTGLGLEPLGCSISVTPPTCDTAFYVISPTEAVSMNVQSSPSVIVTADQ